MSTARLAPTAPAERIHAIDAVRGLALLGILLVNIHLFADAFGTYTRPRPEGGPLDAAAFYVVKVFCEGKFYPLFSLLFGIGLTIQAHRARAAGRSFLGTGVRRLLFLGALGLIHGLFLWYGDILFLYACVGTLALAFSRARPRTLLITASGFMLVGVFLMSVMSLLSTLGPVADTSAPEPSATAAAPAPADQSIPPFERVWGPLTEGKLQPQDETWINAEREAYSRGPWEQAQKFRVLSWAFMIYIYIFGFGWQVAAMFLSGAALIKLNFFAPERRAWHIRLLLLGALVGLPLCTAAAFAADLFGERYFMLGMPLVMIGGPMMSLAYLSAVTLLVNAGRMQRTCHALAAAGRMALTNYLSQTLICTAIFYSWGLGLFGQASGSQGVLLAVGVFACQLALSALWMSRFRFGPMEWLWRNVTYLRPQPMLRPRDPAAPSGPASPAA